MSKGKATATIVVLVAIMLGVALFAAASQTSLLLAGDYYVKIDNAHISENEPADGFISLESREPYVYDLRSVNEAGDEAKLKFGASRELRQGAFLKLNLQPIRGVLSWSEVLEEELPPTVASVLN